MQKVVYITGASSGLGYSLAKVFVTNGHKVALIARREERLEQLRSELGQNSDVLAIGCDVTHSTQIKKSVVMCQEQLGPIDIMIANAGVGITSPATSFKAQALEKTFSVNVFGAAYCFEAVIPDMIQRGSGHLVAISSLAGYRGMPPSGAYCASKAALTALMEAFRVELAPHGIHSTTIMPGFVKSEMTAQNKFEMPFLLETEDAAQRMYRAILKRKKEYAFPWQMAGLIKTLHLMPNVLYDRIMAGLIKQIKNWPGSFKEPGHSYINLSEYQGVRLSVC